MKKSTSPTGFQFDLIKIRQQLTFWATMYSSLCNHWLES